MGARITLALLGRCLLVWFCFPEGGAIETIPKTLSLVACMSAGLVVASQASLAQDVPTDEPPLERECFTNMVSEPNLEWKDATGLVGSAVPTFGHVGCRDPSCRRPPSVWPYVFNGSGGRWIWKKQLILPIEAQRGDRVSFFDRFCRPRDCGAVTAVNLLISADNAYEVYYVDL